MSAPINHEAARFGRTGPSHIQDLRWEFMTDAEAYALDAPAYIARGSLQAHWHPPYGAFDGYTYISATEVRP